MPIKSLRAESDTSALGVTKRVQQETIARPAKKVVDEKEPVLVISMNESPTFRFENITHLERDDCGKAHDGRSEGGGRESGRGDWSVEMKSYHRSATSALT